MSSPDLFDGVRQRGRRARLGAGLGSALYQAIKRRLLVPGMAVREFECTLCQQPFTLLSGDFFLPEPNICDDCLIGVWELEGEALEKYVAECLVEGATFPVSKIVEHINWH